MAAAGDGHFRRGRHLAEVGQRRRRRHRDDGRRPTVARTINPRLIRCPGAYRTGTPVSPSQRIRHAVRDEVQPGRARAPARERVSITTLQYIPAIRAPATALPLPTTG